MYCGAIFRSLSALSALCNEPKSFTTMHDHDVPMDKALNRLEAMSIVPNDVFHDTLLQCQL